MGSCRGSGRTPAAGTTAAARSRRCGRCGCSRRRPAPPGSPRRRAGPRRRIPAASRGRRTRAPTRRGARRRSAASSNAANRRTVTFSPAQMSVRSRARWSAPARSTTPVSPTSRWMTLNAPPVSPKMVLRHSSLLPPHGEPRVRLCYLPKASVNRALVGAHARVNASPPGGLRQVRALVSRPPPVIGP